VKNYIDKLQTKKVQIERERGYPNQKSLDISFEFDKLNDAISFFEIRLVASGLIS